MPTTDLAHLSLAEAAALVAARQVSPVELTRTMLDRIASLDGTLHAFLTVTGEIALEQARAAEAAIVRGGVRSPVHGIPLAYKDLFATRGVRTTAASRLLADWTPDADATAVARLHAAGAVMVGKLMMNEFAFGVPERGAYGEHARNPWDPARTPGGSSSGSGAAVAAGLCYGALGSDTGGSIRGPAALCGIVGLKPTYGRVSRAGVVPLAWSLDHAGPMARTVEDCAILLQIIAGHDPADPASADEPVPDYRAALRTELRGLRAGVPRGFFFDGVDDEVAARVEEALRVLEALGAAVVEVELPEAHLAPLNVIILLSEAYTYHAADERGRGDLYPPRLRSRIQNGALFFAHEYLNAQRGRELMRRAFVRALQAVDVLVTPTVSHPAGALDELLDAVEPPVRPMLTAPFNLTGLPAISVPCGFTAAGLPVGLQIAGRAFDEATVLAVAHAYERAAGWHRRRPPLA
jgi:aspartyl-tRNA(Asn)/glutamyl-tRNA(Gln) amidotransferase subunit A